MKTVVGLKVAGLKTVASLETVGVNKKTVGNKCVICKEHEREYGPVCENCWETVVELIKETEKVKLYAAIKELKHERVFWFVEWIDLKTAKDLVYESLEFMLKEDDMFDTEPYVENLLTNLRYVEIYKLYILIRNMDD